MWNNDGVAAKSKVPIVLSRPRSEPCVFSRPCRMKREGSGRKEWCWGVFWRVWGHLGAHIGSSWGSLWAPLLALWGASRAFSGSSLRTLLKEGGPNQGRPGGTRKAAFRAVSGHSWGALGSPRDPLRAALLEPSRGSLGPSWRHRAASRPSETKKRTCEHQRCSVCV